MLNPIKSTAGYAKRVWTPEEDMVLIENVNNIGSTSWNAIAELFPGRTGKQCRERWHNHLINGGCKKGDWTQEDDLLITIWHSRLGNQWSSIAKFLDGRSANDIKNRFYSLERLQRRMESSFVAESSNYGGNDEFPKHLGKKSEGYSKKVWSPEEDAVLSDKIKTLGRINWNVIASYLPERTGKQCRERYQHHLIDGIKKGDWTLEEDMTILSTHSKIGNFWAKISKLLPDRSSNDVRNRFRSLTKGDESSCVSVDCYGTENSTSSNLMKKRNLNEIHTETETSSDYNSREVYKRSTSTDSEETNWSEVEYNNAELESELSLNEGICCFHNFLKSLTKES